MEKDAYIESLLAKQSERMNSKQGKYFGWLVIIA